MATVVWTDYLTQVLNVWVQCAFGNAFFLKEVGEFFVGNSGKGFNLGNDWGAILCDDIDIFARASKAKSRNAFCEKRVKGAMQCVTDSASTIGLWASSTWSRSTPALLHCGLPSCLPPLINIFGQVCPSDCHWSYRPRPRPVNWHWTDSGGETRRQLTSLTDFWHNYFRCQCQAHASNMYGENTIVLQFKSSKTEFIWNWQCEYCSKYHRDNRELWGSNESIKVQQFNPSYLVLRPP